MAQLQAINHDPLKLQSIAGENVLGKGYIGESVHTAAMWSGDANPSSHRDGLTNQTNSWTYPKDLDPHGPVKAHIPAKSD